MLTMLLSVWARVGALDQSQWIHAYIDRHRLKVNAHLHTALVDTYGKCKRIDLAYKVFSVVQGEEDVLIECHARRFHDALSRQESS